MAEYDPQADNTFPAVFARAGALMYERKQALKSMGPGFVTEAQSFSLEHAI